LISLFIFSASQSDPITRFECFHPPRVTNQRRRFRTFESTL
jgi:hypothetical protein